MTQADTVEELGAEYFQDPYAVHQRLRARRPVSQVIMPGGGTPVWMITGYAEVRAALADPRLGKTVPGWHPDPDSIGALDGHMLNSDPPDHGRLRRLVNKAFTTRRVEQLRPRITAITAALLDEMSARREVDLLASFAFPLPITVICELLGIPVADRDDFRAWSSIMISDTATPAAYEAAATAMVRYFKALLAAKRREPADDLLSALVLARDEGDALRETELISMVFLLLVAGHETTVNLIASGMLALLLNPGELGRLRADPSLRGAAVEELLRYTSPVNHATFRFATEPIEIGEARIGRGATATTRRAALDRSTPSAGSRPDRRTAREIAPRAAASTRSPEPARARSCRRRASRRSRAGRPRSCRCR